MTIRQLSSTRAAAAAVSFLLGAYGCGSRSGLDLWGSIGQAPSPPTALASPDAGIAPPVAPPETTAAPEAGSPVPPVVINPSAPPSCQEGGTGAGKDCGASGTSDCCRCSRVPGGTFARSFNNGWAAGIPRPATVSGFCLDAYEVTVGRFRTFVNASVSGWLPTPGSGKHTHLNGGRGLEDTAVPGTYETGWDAPWTAKLATTEATWGENLRGTWTRNAGTNEHLPIDGVTWYEAYAFCIWDNAFLPSEAEWYYAAAAGNEQRLYPWGSVAPGPNTDLAVYGCYYGGGNGTCMGVPSIAPVGSIPAGNGKWGQSDLAGNIQEWVLDWFGSYNTPCVDCAQLTSGVGRVSRGGDYQQGAAYLQDQTRDPFDPTGRFGVRCARTP